MLLGRSLEPLRVDLLVIEEARSFKKSGLRLDIEGILGSFTLESAQLSLIAFILLLTWAETSVNRLSSPREEARDIVRAVLRESSDADLLRRVVCVRRLASCGRLGSSPTVPETSSGSGGELTLRKCWIERSRFSEAVESALLLLVLEGH